MDRRELTAQVQDIKEGRGRYCRLRAAVRSIRPRRPRIEQKTGGSLKRFECIRGRASRKRMLGIHGGDAPRQIGRVTNHEIARRDRFPGPQTVAVNKSDVETNSGEPIITII